jgi:BREX system ATP-binding protein BrxC/D
VTALTADPRLAARRSVEALRSGVPCRDAVAALGSGQTEIEDHFTTLLDRARMQAAARGLLLGGGFGSGKSHVLEHLAHLALERGFVVSRIVISKETPLHDPAKVLRAAVESALTPDGAVGAVGEAVASLDTDTSGYAELLRWASGSGAPVDERFALTLGLLPRVQAADDDFAEAIVRFWSGDTLSVAALRQQAKWAGMGRPVLGTVPARELAVQRFRFLSHLFTAAGHEGWVLLFDEVELIGRYTLLQRSKSYAELSDWLRPDASDSRSGLISVLAMTDDFDAAVLTARDDRSVVPSKLRDKQQPAWDEIAGRAEVGMRLIERDMVRLRDPDSAELDRAYARLKAIHSLAFGWDAPDVAGLERLGATRMRQYVRAWINEWDLVRLDPTYTPATEVAPLNLGYAEQPDLEHDAADEAVN